MKWVPALVRTEEELYTSIKTRRGVTEAYTSRFCLNREMRNNCGKYIEVFQVISPPSWCQEYVPTSEKKDWYKDKVGFYWHVSAFEKLDGQNCRSMEDWINEMFPPAFPTIVDDKVILEEDY